MATCMRNLPAVFLKLLSLSFAFALYSSCRINRSAVSPEALVKKTLVNKDSVGIEILGITNWMHNIPGTKYKQGTDCYKNFVCQFCAEHSSLYIFDIEKKELVTTVTLPALGSAYHCNNVDFSSTFYDETDPFPLLYSSHQGRDARCVLVDRIYYDGDDYKVETIQRIDIPFEIDLPLGYSPDVILDKDNNYLYVYAGNTRTITDFYIYKFRLPHWKKENVKLKGRDLLSSWVIKGNPSYYKQGGMVSNNVLYVVEGVPGLYTDNKLRVIDLDAGSYKVFNLTEMFDAKWEPEDVFMFDNKLFVASSQSGIFLLHLKESFDH